MAWLAVLLATLSCAAAEQELARELRQLDTSVVPASQRDAARRDWIEEIRRRRQAANAGDMAAWNAVNSREDWELMRGQRLKKLVESLSLHPQIRRPKVRCRVSGRLAGDGFAVENLVYRGRMDYPVTANLYLPEPARKSMPGIVLCHSHHSPRTQGELQDMGMTWARAGCCVLVIDQLGHGERRQHTFRTSEDYPGTFRRSRQDYYFRYDVGVLMHLSGESLIGWMVEDMRCGIDLLVSREGVDSKRIIVMGAVAGGGDPAGVTAAVDDRVAVAVPFNFGGPQPESPYPLPEDAATSFNYLGGGSWESTRNLKGTAPGGFFHWAIVGSLAPRRLIYGHEFSWDRERDPVWKRLQRIWGWYDRAGNLGFAHGHGLLRGDSAKASHCNNIGPVHRKMISPYLSRWMDVPVPAKEYRKRFEVSRLQAWPVDTDSLPPVHTVLQRLVSRLDLQLDKRPDGGLFDRRRTLSGSGLVSRLGPERVATSKTVQVLRQSEARVTENVSVNRVLLKSSDGVRIPLLLMRNSQGKRARAAVVMVAQAGKRSLLKSRAGEVASLLAGGVAVCLVDVRGTGETRAGDGRTRRSYATSLSSTELMLGTTTLGQRLQDLCSVLAWLRTVEGIDMKRLAVWGDSLAEPNPPKTRFAVPHGVDSRPRGSEPLGPLLAVLALWREPSLAAAVGARGGLVAFSSVLGHRFVYLPHDCVVPGAAILGDIAGVVELCRPRPLRLAGLVDGYNRAVSPQVAEKAYSRARAAYRRAGAGSSFELDASQGPTQQSVAWLLKVLEPQSGSDSHSNLP